MLIEELDRDFKFIARTNKNIPVYVKAMKDIANNENIGYGQNNRLTLYTEAKKVGFDCSKIKNKCNTDCSTMVRTALKSAGYDLPSDFRTKNEKANLEKIGFEIIKFDKTKLKTGDILFTPNSHTAVVVEA